jgi:hypothetical protein
MSCLTDRGAMPGREGTYAHSETSRFRQGWRGIAEYFQKILFGVTESRWTLAEFGSEEEAIQRPLAAGFPVLYVLAVRGCRYSEFTRRLFERCMNTPVLPLERKITNGADPWLIGDSVQMVWVDCGCSTEAEAFCQARGPHTIPCVELAIPVAHEDPMSGSGYTTIEFSRDTWDWSVIGLRAFLRTCGVLPPPGLPPWLYERWLQTRRGRMRDPRIPENEDQKSPEINPGRETSMGADETQRAVP